MTSSWQSINWVIYLYVYNLAGITHQTQGNGNGVIK